MSEVEPFLRISACSYEGSLFGWNVSEDTTDEGLDIAMSYGFNCCQSSLRCVTVSKSGKLLACGGMDERIRLYNVVEGRSVGEMSNQSGALTCLQFFGDSYLLAGSEDSTVSIWRVHDCVCVHILGGHKAAILSIGIHPSGKLALTTSKDGYIKMWNLVQGRCAFTRRLKAPADKVLWHSNSLYYLLVVGLHVQVFSAADNTCVCDVAHTSRINQAVFATVAGDGAADIRIATVCENMTLYLHTISGQETAQLSLKELGGRPRDISSCIISDYAKESISNGDLRQVVDAMGSCLVIATSTGVISALSCNAVETSGKLEEAQVVTATVRIEPRFISVVAWNISNPVGMKAGQHEELDFFRPESFTSDVSSSKSQINSKRGHNDDSDEESEGSDEGSDEKTTSRRHRGGRNDGHDDGDGEEEETEMVSRSNSTAKKSKLVKENGRAMKVGKLKGKDRASGKAPNDGESRLKRKRVRFASKN